MKKLLTFITLIILLVIACGCSNNEPHSITDIALDTVVSITIYHIDENALTDNGIRDNSEYAKQLLTDSLNMTKEYEKLFSPYIEESDIYKINHAESNPIIVDITTLELIEKGIEYSKLSDGCFDITCGALNELWHIKDNDGYIPSDDEIKEALSTIDYNLISLDNNNCTVTLNNPDTHIDLGAIAKGYIADKIKDYLVENGVDSAIINLGGNVLMIGGKYQDSLFLSDKRYTDFTIGIPKPFHADEICKTFTLQNKSVVTSGNYQRFFEKDGIIYHHIMNLKTGYPARAGISSASIICDESVDGDALSTICFILGEKEGKEFLDKLPFEVDSFWVESEEE